MPTILVVDDTQTAALELALEGAGFDVVTARSRQDALERSRAGLKPDCVLTDCNMPEKNAGIELTKELHASHPDLPIVMLTTINDFQTEPAFKAAGGTSFFVKTVGPGALKDVIPELQRLTQPGLGKV